MFRPAAVALMLLAATGLKSAHAFAGASVGIFRPAAVPSTLGLRVGGARSVAMGLGVGDTLDKSLELFVREDGKMNKYSCEELFGGKKSVLFAVPGAFTPTCSEKHLPSFVSLHDDLKAAGVDEIACVSVNDPFVMKEWGAVSGADGKVKMLSDGNAKFSEAIGQLQDITAGGMGMRSNRYAMVLDKDLKVELLALEDGGYGNTSAEAVLKFVSGQ